MGKLSEKMIDAAEELNTLKLMALEAIAEKFFSCMPTTIHFAEHLQERMLEVVLTVRKGGRSHSERYSIQAGRDGKQVANAIYAMRRDFEKEGFA